jgi:transcriptional regulator with XRE-family HTH domain
MSRPRKLDAARPPAMNRKPSFEIRCRLADNLERYRHCRGYTQEELADYCGFHRTYVSNVELATLNITLANPMTG